MDMINPANAEVFASIDTINPEDVAGVVLKMRAAQKAWAMRPFSERKKILSIFNELLEAKAEILAQTLTQEMGKPTAQAQGEIRACKARIQFFLDSTEVVLDAKAVHRAGEAETPGSLVEEIHRRPLGVVANISAWNYPYFVGSNVFVPALLCGNAVAYKPSEITSLTGKHIAELLFEAGVPEDIFVPFYGGGEVGQALLDADIDGVYFTGSYATGKAIAKAVAGRMIPVQLELGGKDPMYVRPDVDIEVVAQGLADGAFYNNGQSCCSVERIYVHADIYDSFVEHFLSTVSGFKMGDPSIEGTYLGPLTREAQIKFLEAQVLDAQKKGATLRCGGKAAADMPGYYFEATVFTDVDHTMDIMREESFGPIIGIMKVESDAEAITLMNDTRYGLTAGVFTQDESAARKLMPQLDAGSVYWNCCDRVSPNLPWTGWKNSGLGSTLSTLGIEAFLQPQGFHLRWP